MSQIHGVTESMGCLNVLFFRSERTLSQPASTIYEMFFIPANVFTSERTHTLPAAVRTRNHKSNSRALTPPRLNRHPV